jgi:hypothetical protein
MQITACTSFSIATSTEGRARKSRGLLPAKQVQFVKSSSQRVDETTTLTSSRTHLWASARS